jgi:hypothetical protein
MEHQQLWSVPEVPQNPAGQQGLGSATAAADFVSSWQRSVDPLHGTWYFNVAQDQGLRQAPTRGAGQLELAVRHSDRLSVVQLRHIRVPQLPAGSTVKRWNAKIRRAESELTQSLD